MDHAKRLDYLRDEYLKLQDQYEDYDRRSLTIKGWVSAGSIAGIAAGLNATEPTGLLIWPVIALIAACIWYLEARWKMFQYATSDRIRILEAIFRDDKDLLIKENAPFQIYHWWFRSYSKDKPIYEYETTAPTRPENRRPRSYNRRLWSAGKQWFVMQPYALIIVISILGLFVSATLNGCQHEAV